MIQASMTLNIQSYTCLFFLKNLGDKIYEKDKEIRIYSIKFYVSIK